MVDQVEQHLKRNKVDIKKSQLHLSPTLEFDADSQKFVHGGADDANRYLRRDYRSKFVVPAMA